MLELTISEEMRLYLLGLVKRDQFLGYMSNAHRNCAERLIEVLKEPPDHTFTDGHGNNISHLIGEAND